MTDATADVDSGEEKKSSKGKLIGAGGAVVLLLAAGYFFLGGSSQTAVEEQPVVVEQTPAVFYELPSIMVNLAASSGARQQYLKLTVSLEIKDEETKMQIEPIMPRVMDTFQVYLRELRADDLEGSSGMFRLKEELRKRVNAAVAPARVDAILFTEMLVQ